MRKKESIIKLLSLFVEVQDKSVTKVSEHRLYNILKSNGIEDIDLTIDNYNYIVENLFQHKVEVYKAGMSPFEKYNSTSIDINQFNYNLLVHDFSKMHEDELESFTFLNSNKRQKKDGFNKAWLHHKNHNKHHPEYFYSVNRLGKVQYIEMPEIYIVEMVADWIGAGKSYETPFEDWLKPNLNQFRFNKKSALNLQKILNSIDVKTEYIKGNGYSYLNVIN